MVAVSDPGAPELSLTTADAALGRSRRARPSRLHIADDGLPTVIDVDVLDPNVLIPTVT
jgi:hypothetical protein